MTTKTEKVQKVNQDANHFDFFPCFLGTLPRNSKTLGIMGLHWALLQTKQQYVWKKYAHLN